MIGGILVTLAFVACFVSVLAYARNHLRGTPRSLALARAFFHLTVISVILGSATLLYLLLTHQFQYTYVWSYSSRALSTPLLISTFYAGQEGSLMLWALFTALIGVFLMRHSARYGYEAQVMSVFGAAFALWANLQVGWTIVRRNPKAAGGSIAHIGIALMFFGFIASTEFDAMQTVSLPQGQPVQALGYTLKYTGYRMVEGDRYAFDVEVERDGKRFRLAPVMYESKYNEGIMRHPDIVNLISKDFYLAPLSLDQPVTPASTQARAVEVLIVEASVKPYINLVWAGVIILLLGFLVTIVRRAVEAGQTATAEQEVVRQASPGTEE